MLFDFFKQKNNSGNTMFSNVQKCQAIEHIINLADRMAGSASQMGMSGYDTLIQTREELKQFVHNTVLNTHEDAKKD